MKNKQDKTRRHGGKRAGAGRTPGTPNKATADLRDIAQQYTSEAVEALVKVMRGDGPPAAIVGAASAILDRGYGKPAQTLHATHKIERDPADLTDAELADIASRSGNGASDAAPGPPEPSKLH